MTIPRGSIACVLTLFITAIFVACVTVSLPTGSDGGVVALSLTPLNPGFSLMFNMDINVATALSIPATFATAYGFVFAYSRVIISMARSGLFPPILMKTCGKYETPYVTVLVGSVLGYGLCIAAYFEPTFLLYLYNICIMSALMAYTSQVWFTSIYPPPSPLLLSKTTLPPPLTINYHTHTIVYFTPPLTNRYPFSYHSVWVILCSKHNLNH